MAISKKRRFALVSGVVAVVLLAGGWTLLRMRSASRGAAPTGFIQVGHDIFVLRFSRDSKKLLTAEGSGNGQATLWDVESRQSLLNWEGSGNRSWFSADGARLLSVTHEERNRRSSCVLREMRTGRVLRRWEIAAWISAASSDLSLLLCASYPDPKTKTQPRFVRLQEAATGKVRGQVESDAIGALGARFSANGRFVCVPGREKPAQVLRTGDFKPVLPLPVLSEVRLSLDGRTILGLNGKAQLHRWDLLTGRHAVTSTGLDTVLWIYGLKSGAIVVGGGKNVAQGGGSYRGVVQVWAPDISKVLWSHPDLSEASSVDGQLLAFKMWPVGRVSPGEVRPTFEIWDAESGQVVTRFDPAIDPAGQPVSLSRLGGPCAFSPDKRRFAFGTYDGLVRLFDLGEPAKTSSPTQRMMSTSGGNSVVSFQNAIDAVAILPGGGVAASGSDDGPYGKRLIKIVDANGHEQSYPTGTGISDLGALGVSPDGKTLVGSSQWGVWQMDLVSRQQRETPLSTGTFAQKNYSYHAVGRPLWLRGAAAPFSVASADPFGTGPVTLTDWDAVGKQSKTKVLAQRRMRKSGRSYLVSSVTPSGNGQKLLLIWAEFQSKQTQGKSSEIQTGAKLMEVRQTATGRELLSLELPQGPGFRGRFGQPAWSPDGKTIAISNERGPITLWDVVAGRQVGQISGVQAEAWNASGTPVMYFDPAPQLAFTPDGRFLAAGFRDGSITLYSLKTSLAVAQLGKASLKLRWMEFSADGRTLYGVATNGKELLSWDVPQLESQSSSV